MSEKITHLLDIDKETGEPVTMNAAQHEQGTKAEAEWMKATNRTVAGDPTKEGFDKKEYNATQRFMDGMEEAAPEYYYAGLGYHNSMNELTDELGGNRIQAEYIIGGVGMALGKIIQTEGPGQVQDIVPQAVDKYLERTQIEQSPNLRQKLIETETAFLGFKMQNDALQAETQE